MSNNTQNNAALLANLVVSRDLDPADLADLMMAQGLTDKVGFFVSQGRHNEGDVFPRVIATHDGIFHADEVFGAAILAVASNGGRFVVLRTRRQDVLEAIHAAGGVVLDVGGKHEAPRWLDHHQRGFPYRQEIRGVLHEPASAGLAWEHYGRDAIRAEWPESLPEPTEEQLEDVFASIRKSLIVPIDLFDARGEGYQPLPRSFGSTSIQGVIRAYALDEFTEAWEWAWSHLRRVIRNAALAASPEALALKAKMRMWCEEAEAGLLAGGDGIVVMEEFVPGWQGMLEDYPTLRMVVHPRLGGGWSAAHIPLEEGSNEGRVMMPREWGGLNGEELDVATAPYGVPPGAVFVHRGLFTSGHASFEGALAMARAAK